MKNITFLLIGLLAFVLHSQAVPQLNTDSIGFEQHRDCINTLLEERSKKFGDLDISLQQKTGIFGIFKTKKDMQRSIDILRQIVLTDNHIFLETKKLLDIKDNESDRHESLANEYDAQITAYMRTISKLQAENEQLRGRIELLGEEGHNVDLLAYLLVFVILVLSGVIVWLYRKNKNLTQE